MTDTFRLGLVQHACSTDPDTNIDRAAQGIASAARQGANLVCLQELFRTRYFCRSEDDACFDLAEEIPGATSQALEALAREHSVALIGSIFERRTAGLYHNTALVIDERGGTVSRYRKMHIPDDPAFYEKFYFTPGDAEGRGGGFETVEVSGATVAPLICWDQWFPEAARMTALLGAQILVYPTAIGWLQSEKGDYGKDQKSAWETMHRAHAIANGCFVACVNRVGIEDEIEFWGASQVYDPFGRLLASAGDDEQVLVVDCDLGLIERTRREWPFLRDRRIDAYSGLSRRMLDADPKPKAD